MEKVEGANALNAKSSELRYFETFSGLSWKSEEVEVTIAQMKRSKPCKAEIEEHEMILAFEPKSKVPVFPSVTLY